MEFVGLDHRSQHANTAVQYLIWAIEEITKSDHPTAALHAQIALEELRHTEMVRNYSAAAKRFRDKAEQLSELAGTEYRRDALMNIVENYRRTAAQMESISQPQLYSDCPASNVINPQGHGNRDLVR